MSEVNLVAVLVSTLVTMAVASLWYSPMVFGRAWMALVGLSEDTLKAEGSKMMRTMALGFVVQYVMLFALAYTLSLTESASPMVVALLMWLLVGAVITSNVVWERKSYLYLAINLGYTLVVFMSSAYIVTNWPW